MYITIFAEQKRVGMAKKKRIIDKLYNGAFENAKLTKSSERALLTSGLMVVAGLAFLIKTLKK